MGILSINAAKATVVSGTWDRIVFVRMLVSPEEHSSDIAVATAMG